MSAIYLEVEVYAGQEIKGAIAGMVDVATRIGINVHTTFNDVRILARPNDDADAIHHSWDSEMASKKPYKFASSNPTRETGDD